MLPDPVRPNQCPSRSEYRVSRSLKDRHRFGMGAAACAVCCAAPLLSILGVAGAAATVATFVFAGVVFGLVVAAGALYAARRQRRQRQREARVTEQGPVDVALSARLPGREA